MHSTLHINTASCLQLENPGLQSEWLRNLQKDDIPPLRLFLCLYFAKRLYTMEKNECASYINTKRSYSPPSL
jgi:hypothetical protein